MKLSILCQLLQNLTHMVTCIFLFLKDMKECVQKALESEFIKEKYHN